MRSRTSRATSTYVSVVISPATTTSPVVISVSQATRLRASSASHASRTASEIWSAILSGWPSVTDSEVKRNERALMGAPRLADVQEKPHRALLERGRHGDDDGAQRLDVRAHVGRQRLVPELCQRLDEPERLLEIDPGGDVLVVRHAGGLDRVLVAVLVDEPVAALGQRLDAGGLAREHEAAVERRVEDREVAQVELGCRDVADRPRERLGVEELAGRVDQLVDRPPRLLLVLDLEHERDLGEDRTWPHPEHTLLVEERGDVLERDAEQALHVLEIEAGTRREVAELLGQLQATVLAVRVDERECVGRHLLGQVAVVGALEADVLVEEMRDEAGARPLRPPRGRKGYRITGDDRQRAGASAGEACQRLPRAGRVEPRLGQSLLGQLAHQLLERVPVGERLRSA